MHATQQGTYRVIGIPGPPTNLCTRIDGTRFYQETSLDAGMRKPHNGKLVPPPHPQALKQCGLYHVLGTYLEGAQESPELAEQQAECAWRLGNWDARLPRQCRQVLSFLLGAPRKRALVC